MPSARLGVLRHADYRRYWTASTVSLFGTQVTQIAIPVIAVLVLRATPFEVALLTTIEFLPWILFTLPAGVWVDRLPRRRLLIAGDLGRAAMLVSIPLADALGALTIWQLFVVGFVNGVCTVFFDVADQSYLPTVVARDDLVEGNAKLQVSASSAQILGQPMGGGIVALLTAPFAVIVDAASFVGSALLIARIRAVEAPRVAAGAVATGGEAAADRSTAVATGGSPAGAIAAAAVALPREGMRREIGEGLRYVLGNPYLRGIAASTSTSNLFSNIVFAVFAIYLYRDLSLVPAQVGLIGGAGGFGVLAGALLANRFAAWIGVGRTIVISAALTGPAGLLIPIASPGTAVPLLAAASFLGGMFAVIYNVNQVSLRQAITPERLLGRLNGTMRFLVWGTVPIGSLIGGVLASALGTHAGIWIGTILGFTPFVPLLFSPVPGLRRIPERAEDAGAAEIAGGSASDLVHAGQGEPTIVPDRE
ncbi:MAG: MFS transporter [Chloroflexi bacterium]|nr:MFS transporter [Chloroflexota bacterium]